VQANVTKRERGTTNRAAGGDKNIGGYNRPLVIRILNWRGSSEVKRSRPLERKKRKKEANDGISKLLKKNSKYHSLRETGGKSIQDEKPDMNKKETGDGSKPRRGREKKGK